MFFSSGSFFVWEMNLFYLPYRSVFSIETSICSWTASHTARKSKGYFCYKTITCQNLPSEAQVKTFFGRKVIPFSKHLSFCIFNHPMIYQICDFMMSVSVWDRAHFLIYLLSHHYYTSSTHQTWPVDR